MNTEVLIKCPICKRSRWVPWDKKRDSLCFECPHLSNSPPVMIPQVHSQSCDAVADWFVTREVDKTIKNKIIGWKNNG